MRLRREYRLTGEEIADKLRMARSTVAGWLTRMGLGRLSAVEPQAPARMRHRFRLTVEQAAHRFERAERSDALGNFWRRIRLTPEG